MKKSQILAALALAFALGVVAPVANASYSADTYAAEAARTEATGAEVESVIKYVEANSTYSKIAKVKAAIAEYGSVTLDAGTTVAKVEEAMNGLNGKFVNGTDGAKISSTYTNGSDLATIVAAAEKTTNLTQISKYLSDLNADTFNIDIVRKDVETLRTLGIVSQDVNLSGWTADGTVKTKDDVTTALTGKFANLTEYTTLIGLIDNYTNYSTAYDAIYNAIDAAANADGKEALADLTKGETTISDLSNVADNTNIDRFTLWEAVYTAMGGLDGYTGAASPTNYTNILKVADAYGKAVPVIDYDKTTLAEEMMGYKAPATPEEPSQPINPTDPDTPTTPGADDGKGDTNTPSTDKNGLPNTGVVAEGADASAKSSVSIMAGVSSFITAAGSALVAIRRGKKA